MSDEKLPGDTSHPINSLLMLGLLAPALLKADIEKSQLRAKAILDHADATLESSVLLAKCLPFLRTLEAKKLREEVLKNLALVHEKAEVRKSFTRTDG